MQKSIETFGDARKLILDAMVEIKNKTMTIDDALALAKSLEAINHNVQAEINITKVRLLAQAAGHDFGKIVTMGKTLIGE